MKTSIHAHMYKLCKTYCHMYVGIFLCPAFYLHVCMHLRIFLCPAFYLYVCMNLRIFLCPAFYLHVCMHLRMWYSGVTLHFTTFSNVYTHVYMYTCLQYFNVLLQYM